MDRFIGLLFAVGIIKHIFLKSSMDRFIDITRIDIAYDDYDFKIQYG